MARNAIKKIGFDYTSLGAECRVVVQQKTTEIRDRMGRAAVNIVEIGERLLNVKDSLSHGKFGDWLSAEFDWSIATATRMMQVATEFKFVNLTNLDASPSALYLLASPSTPHPVKRKFVEQIASGKPVTHAEVKDAVKKSKSKPEVFFDDPEPKTVVSVKPIIAKNPEPVAKDDLGQPIIDARIAAMFSRRPEIHTILHELTQIKSKVLGAIEEKDGLFYRIDHSRFKADIENLRRQVRFTEPYALCAYCQGRNPNCKACKGQGWLSKEAHERFVSEDLKV